METPPADLDSRMSSSTSSPRNSHDGEAEVLLRPSCGNHEVVDVDLEVESTNVDASGMTRAQAVNLYTSHMLSTWNARTYEFSAIIFTASAYPNTLAASAIRGIFTTVAMICLSSTIGRWIDHAPNRLRNLLSTIIANRLSVMIACIFWASIVSDDPVVPEVVSQETTSNPSSSSLNGHSKDLVFCVVLLLGVLEKLSGNANTMAMERDWIVVVAAPEGQDYDLTRLNAVMRRIDLICKLTAPIVISAIISAVSSTQIGVFVVGGTSALSWGVEWWCARRVYEQNANLRKLKVVTTPDTDVQDLQRVPQRVPSRKWTILRTLSSSLALFFRDFRFYFSSRVWIPSLALSLLHISALSYSATFITYLLNVGFSLNLITIARAAGSVIEISSTVVTPFGVDYLGKAPHHNANHNSDTEDELEEPFVHDVQSLPGNSETGLERLGLWGITWQLVNLIPVVLALWSLSPPGPGEQTTVLSRLITSYTSSSSFTMLALTIFTFLALSRLGLWIFDLTTQQLTQTLIDPSKRSSFAGVETSFVNVFELCHHVSVVAFSRPQQFKYLATGSLAAVAISATIYAGWVWRQRGHLVHWEKVTKGCECLKSGERESGVRRRL